MTDNTDLKRLAQRVIDIEALDGGEPIGEAWGEFEAAATPAAVLALIAENEELGRYLCTCRDCGGEGALHTGDWHYYGHMEPPEPVMEKCGECDGTGLLGEVQDLYQVITERDQLCAEVAGLRTGYEAYERVNAELKAENERLERNRDMWKGQVERQIEMLRLAHEADKLLKAECEGLPKHAPSSEIIWCECGDGYPANSYGAGFMDANEGVCANCDAALGQGEQP